MFRIINTLTSFFRHPLVFGVTAVAMLCGVLVPVASAQEAAPVVVNEQTQQQVELTRAYWNANVDIANRPMACDHAIFNPESAVYEADFRLSRATDGSYLAQSGEIITHEPLVRDSEGNASNGFVQHPYIPELQARRSAWTVQNGVYSGYAFNFTEYLELVSYNPTTAEFTVGSTPNAVRVWNRGLTSNESTYFVCYALDGTPFIPTGSAELGNNDLPTLESEDFTFQFPQPISADATAPVIYRIDTGEQVQFVRGEWAYNEQLALSYMHCHVYRWEESYQNYSPVPEFGGLSGRGRWFITSFPAYVDGGFITTRTYWTTDYYEYQDQEITPIESFQLFDGDPYMELTDYGFNLWNPPNRGSYHRCTVNAPKRVLPLEAGMNQSEQTGCDYSNADTFDGWGWNPDTMQSCAPLGTDNTSTPVVETVGSCNYSNADMFSGWGWNEATGESCAPMIDSGVMVDQVTTQVPVGCDYSNANMFSGWGWNETTGESCAPLIDSSETVEQVTAQIPAGCDYSDANMFGGWGWNETTRESCAPLTISNEPVEQVAVEVPAGCDYSNAALSGGWGWNDTTRESCAPLSETSEPTEQVATQVPAGCDYSNAALSNGWGWNDATRESCPPL